MKTPEHILVTYDFSPCSKIALNYALELAASTGAELHILHVEVIHSNGPLPENPDKTKGQILHDFLKKEILSDMEKQGLFVSDLNAIRYVVLRDVSPAQAIITYCSDYHIDLVVMGTHGRKGLSRQILGSVTEEVVRRAPSSVLAVHGNDPFEPLHQHLNTITVPVDFSEHSRAALVYAREIANMFQAKLHVIHVIEEYLHPAFYNTGTFSIYDVEPRIEEKVLVRLKQFYEESPGPDPGAHFHVRHGHPARDILEEMDTWDSDMLVLGTHGLTGLNRVIMGSVAERLVRLSPCPVFIVKETKPSLRTVSPFTRDNESLVS